MIPSHTFDCLSPDQRGQAEWRCVPPVALCRLTMGVWCVLPAPPVSPSPAWRRWEYLRSQCGVFNTSSTGGSWSRSRVGLSIKTTCILAGLIVVCNQLLQCPPPHPGGGESSSCVGLNGRLTWQWWVSSSVSGDA